MWIGSCRNCIKSWREMKWKRNEKVKQTPDVLDLQDHLNELVK